MSKTMHTAVIEFLPKTPRENELASFWYYKGRAEADLENGVAFKKAAKKKVSIKVVDKLRSSIRGSRE